MIAALRSVTQLSASRVDEYARVVQFYMRLMQRRRRTGCTDGSPHFGSTVDI
jgi:hypothetical protein